MDKKPRPDAFPLLEAAKELLDHAEALQLSHTVKGTWPSYEKAAKAEHDKLIRLANELQAIAGRKP